MGKGGGQGGELWSSAKARTERMAVILPAWCTQHRETSHPLTAPEALLSSTVKRVPPQRVTAHQAKLKTLERTEMFHYSVVCEIKLGVNNKTENSFKQTRVQVT